MDDIFPVIVSLVICTGLFLFGIGMGKHSECKNTEKVQQELISIKKSAIDRGYAEIRTSIDENMNITNEFVWK